MHKRILLLALAALLIVAAGCQGLLDPQAAKDRDLGKVVENNLKTSSEFMDYVQSFRLVESGVYKCVTRGLTDPQRAGRFAYNAMIVLDERNNTLVKSGRTEFTIIGEGVPPQVTLKGPFEGEVWQPSTGR